MKNALLVAMLAALVVAGAACSARTQLAMEETQKNGAHFATWNHMGYSVNRGTPETTTKGDVEIAKADQVPAVADLRLVGGAGQGAADPVTGVSAPLVGRPPGSASWSLARWVHLTGIS